MRDKKWKFSRGQKYKLKLAGWKDYRDCVVEKAGRHVCLSFDSGKWLGPREVLINALEPALIFVE